MTYTRYGKHMAANLKVWRHDKPDVKHIEITKHNVLCQPMLRFDIIFNNFDRDTRKGLSNFGGMRATSSHTQVKCEFVHIPQEQVQYSR